MGVRKRRDSADGGRDGERGGAGLTAAVAWASARELLAIQGGLAVAVTLLLLVTPIGLGLAVPVVVLAMLFGAWGWAIRLGRARDHLGREAVRALSWRAGVAWGALCAITYGWLATELPLAGRLAVPFALGVGATFAATVLTLCGLDLGRADGAE